MLKAGASDEINGFIMSLKEQKSDLTLALAVHATLVTERASGEINEICKSVYISTFVILFSLRPAAATKRPDDGTSGSPQMSGRNANRNPTNNNRRAKV